MQGTFHVEARRQTRGFHGLLAAVVMVTATALYGPQVRAADADQSRSTTLPRVAVLATGGTIAGQAATRAANTYNAGAVSAQQLVQAVPGIEKLARLSTEQIASIGSP